MHNERNEYHTMKIYPRSFYRVGISRSRCSAKVFLVSWSIFFAFVWSIEKVVQVERGALKLSQFI